MRRYKKATLTDVAQRAGVSVTTASYILNGRSSQMRISAATERRVQDAMQDLDYRPNWSARTLRGSSTQTIGVISDFVASGDFASRLLSGANSAARRSDRVIVIGETLGNPEVERLLIEEMLDRQVDGVLFATLVASLVELPETLRKGRTVLLNCVDPNVDLPVVVPDDVVGGRMAAEHLLAAGVTGAVYVVGEDPTPEATAGRERMEGITGALGGAGAALAGVVPCTLGRGARVRGGERVAGHGRPPHGPDLPQRPRGHGGLPGPRRARPRRPGRCRGDLLRRLRPGHAGFGHGSPRWRCRSPRWAAEPWRS